MIRKLNLRHFFSYYYCFRNLSILKYNFSFMNSKFIILVLFTVFTTSFQMQGQELLSIKKSHFVDAVQTRKVEYSKIKEALSLYDKGLGFVGESLNLFLEAYAVNENNAELNYNLGICYLIAGPKNKALSFLLAAESSNPDISNEIHFYIGLAYQYQNNFSKAITHFKMSNELIVQNNYKEQKVLIPISEKHIRESRNGKMFMENPSDLELELLVPEVNSHFDEFNPQVFNEYLYFSSRRTFENEDARSKQDQKYFEKLFKAVNNENVWGDVRREKNNLGANVHATLLCNFNENQFVFYKSKDGAGDLVLAEKTKGKWKEGKSLKFINTKKSRESSASTSDASNEIYFVSNRKDGFGKCDIYYCQLGTDGKWSKPINVGGDINTEYDEGDVYITRNGKSLYFSSKGHNSMGGYDIFKCERAEMGEWGSPVNLGIPMNSAENDITYSEDAEGAFYFASDRSEGIGGYDIYRQKISAPVIEETPIEEPIEKEIKLIEPVVVPIVDAVKETVKIFEEPMKQELVEEDFVYRVQIAACKKEMNPTGLFRRYKGDDVIEHLFVENWHKYTIGEFSSFEDAAKHRDACGVKDAFIVLFKGGLRLGIARRPIGGK